MANVRRSARVSRNGAGRRSSTGARGYSPKKTRLGSLVERDETPEAATSSIAGILATPANASNTVNHLAQLSGLKTPQTEPQAAKSDMNPKTIHQTTAKAPDSGLKLGFADVADTPSLLATPSKTSHKCESHLSGRQSMASTAPPGFQFSFATQTSLSAEAQKLMETIKADAEQIKAQLIADKAKANSTAASTGQAGTRKIAPAKGKSGRFSDVHMAQFKKMDSIENHASAFRARPAFASPPAQSLKRKSSRAKLDDPERPQTKETSTPKQDQPIPSGNAKIMSSGPMSVSRPETGTSVKRSRFQNDQDVSAHRKAAELTRPTTNLYSPTKSSLARSGPSELSDQPKLSMLQRPPSLKSPRSVATIRAVSRPSTVHAAPPNTKKLATTPSKLPQSQNLYSKPLPALPLTFGTNVSISQPVGKPGTSQKFGFATKLPSLTNLKSILRSGRKDGTIASRSGYSSPDRALQKPTESSKKVDFTPSVKSRYAVKLATESPLRAKARRDTPRKANDPPGFVCGSAAYEMGDDGFENGDYEFEEVSYPELPPVSDSPGPVVHTFAAKANELNRRESKEFKSIFTDLHAEKTFPAVNLTSINTVINKTDPARHVVGMIEADDDEPKKMQSPTIRHVRTSNVGELVQPFENQIATVPHGIPGKKRRYNTIAEDDQQETNEHTGDRSRDSAMLAVPGAWTDTILDEQENVPVAEDEGGERSSKRLRTSTTQDTTKIMARKQNLAREKAAKSAKDRKGKAILSLSRLNILSRPKPRS